MKDQIETFSFSLPKGVKTISDHNVKNIRDLDEYIDEICSVFTFLGEITSAMIDKSQAQTGSGYTSAGSFGHYLVFNMAIKELRKFGDLIGCHAETKEV